MKWVFRLWWIFVWFKANMSWASTPAIVDSLLAQMQQIQQMMLTHGDTAVLRRADSLVIVIRQLQERKVLTSTEAQSLAFSARLLPVRYVPGRFSTSYLRALLDSVENFVLQCPPSEPHCRSLLHGLASAYRALERYAEAYYWMNKFISARQQYQTPTLEQKLRDHYLLALYALRAHEYTQARIFLDSAYQLIQHHPALKKDHYSVGTLIAKSIYFDETGQVDSVPPVLYEALQWVEEEPTLQSPRLYALIYGNIAESYIRLLREREDAIEVSRRSRLVDSIWYFITLSDSIARQTNNIATQIYNLTRRAHHALLKSPPDSLLAYQYAKEALQRARATGATPDLEEEIEELLMATAPAVGDYEEALQCCLNLVERKEREMEKMRESSELLSSVQIQSEVEKEINFYAAQFWRQCRLRILTIVISVLSVAILSSLWIYRKRTYKAS